MASVLFVEFWAKTFGIENIFYFCGGLVIFQQRSPGKKMPVRRRVRIPSALSNLEHFPFASKCKPSCLGMRRESTNELPASTLQKKRPLFRSAQENTSSGHAPRSTAKQQQLLGKQPMQQKCMCLITGNDKYCVRCTVSTFRVQRRLHLYVSCFKTIYKISDTYK